jgi:hypothetical protein
MEIMKRLLLCTALAALTANAWATEYGRVTSVKPMIEQVCSADTQSYNGAAPCAPGAPTQPTVTGYQIEYRYKGQTYSAQVPSDPGKSVALQFDPNSGSPVPMVADAPQGAPGNDPSYAGSAPPQGYPPDYQPGYQPGNQPGYAPQPGYYPDPNYYAPPQPAYYAPAYYGPAYYGPPVVGVGIGIGFGGGWHGGGGGWHHH